MRKSVILASLAGLLTLSLLPRSQAQQAAAAKPEVKQALEEINKALFTGGRAPAEKVAPQLKALGQQDLSQSDRETWVRLARDAALRLGDKAWLESLKAVPDTFSSEMIYKVLLAYGQLAKADIAGATATLDSLAAADKRGEINVREQRRMLSLRARIAQLTGKPKEERAQIEALVEHLPYWPKETCQSCHGSLAEPKTMTSLPITNLWFGERFVEILKRDGDAARVKATSEAKLKADPKDDLARIRLGFALQALGQAEAADKTFRELSWAEFPGRELKKPRMMTTFP